MSSASGRIPNWKIESGYKLQNGRWEGMFCGKLHLTKLIGKKTNKSIGPSDEGEINLRLDLFTP